MKRIKQLVSIFCAWTLVGVYGKLMFVAVYHSLIGVTSFGDVMGIISHGLKLDVAIAGYLTIVPALLMMISLWMEYGVIRKILLAYNAIVGTAVALAMVSNTGLYGYWGFPLDYTPVLYLRTSPSDALASLTFMQLLGAVVALAVFAGVVYLTLLGVVRKHLERSARSFVEFGILLLLSASLVIPIRGGFGTGTNHTGSVYLSDNIRFNHAAVNPVFCFLESAMHHEDIGSQYRFYDDTKATQIFNSMIHTASREVTDSTEIRLKKTENVNVVVVILESFSNVVMHHKDSVIPNVNRYAREGVYFSRIYADSQRTDRGMVSILSGLPAQPTMSIMDMPHKTNNLYSIARSLSSKGYSTSYYYGGDTNYSNMNSYLSATGYQTVISEKDFPSRQRTTKWGVADGPVFERALQDIRSKAVSKGGKPYHVTVQTSSSHEPFDVPFKKFDNEVLNAFAYADDCLGKFVEGLRQLPDWDNTLIVLVPDHLGSYPEHLDNYALWRYEIPVVMTGGVIEKHSEVRTIGSQHDIPATLLSLLAFDHSEFTYSKDLLDPLAPHFAYFSFPDVIGMVSEEGAVVYDNTSGASVFTEGKADDLLYKAKAYVQKLYDDIDAR